MQVCAYDDKCQLHLGAILLTRAVRLRSNHSYHRDDSKV
jgi:hypothetical protein